MDFLLSEMGFCLRREKGLEERGFMRLFHRKEDLR